LGIIFFDFLDTCYLWFSSLCLYAKPKPAQNSEEGTRYYSFSGFWSIFLKSLPIFSLAAQFLRFAETVIRLVMFCPEFCFLCPNFCVLPWDWEYVFEKNSSMHHTFYSIYAKNNLMILILDNFDLILDKRCTEQSLQEISF